ncbi:MAG: hypothetical protein RL385_2293 [Pseudomonadota bacterium]
MTLTRRSSVLASVWPLLVGWLGACEAHDRVLPYEGATDAAARPDAAVLPADGAADVPDATFPADGGHDAGQGSTEAGIAVPDAAISDGGSADAAVLRAKDPDCDMTGLWMAKQLTRSEALGLGQFANYWYFFEFVQDGENVTVVHHYDCDAFVQGSVTVLLGQAARRALLSHNQQDGRRASMKKTADGYCALEFEPFWSLRGADPARFLPADRASKETAAQLRARLPLPTAQNPSGAEDWENDGHLGFAWEISGIASGTRNSVQRDVTMWFTDATHTITPALDFRLPLTLRARFDNDEEVIHATSSLLQSLSTPDQSAVHRATLVFLGRTRSDSRAQANVLSDPMQTCDRIVAALPAESSL